MSTVFFCCIKYDALNLMFRHRRMIFKQNNNNKDFNEGSSAKIPFNYESFMSCEKSNKLYTEHF